MYVYITANYNVNQKKSLRSNVIIYFRINFKLHMITISGMMSLLSKVTTDIHFK